MRGLTAAAVAEPDPADLTARAFAALDRRLSPGDGAPVCVAVSGGGDSMALLALAADWAEARRRRLMLLSVDHGLQPDGAAWSAFAVETARRLGVEGRVLRWEGDKPATGLPAAARAARHALLADAAREAGARVILMAHTADDVDEGAVMRAQGSTLGALREWGPSPAWPEGRGVFLLRPLLDMEREALRAFLRSRGLAWVEDPANADLRYGRSRARLAIASSLNAGPDLRHPVPSSSLSPARCPGPSAPRRSAATPAPGTPPPASCAGSRTSVRAEALPPSGMTEIDGGGIVIARSSVTTQTVAAALLCAAGTTRPPRRDSLDRLLARLQAGAPFAATLAGARIISAEDAVTVVRDAGEFSRGGTRVRPVPLSGVSVWDGRFEIAPPGEGWGVLPLAGRMARLSGEDFRAVQRFSPFLRPSLPVLVRLDSADGDARPVLAASIARVRALAWPRFVAACGLIAHEDGI